MSTPRARHVSSSASGIGAPPTTARRRLDRSALLEVRLLRHEEVDRRHAHHRRHPLLARSARGSAPDRSSRSSTTVAAFPPREQRLDVPPAAVELRQHLKRDVVGRQPGAEVEGEVRPEAVGVGQQRSLRLSGRARRVDQEQRVVVVDLGRSGLASCADLAEPPPGRADRGVPEARVGQLRILVLDEEDRRLGVVELVGELGRREPPAERNEDEAGLRSRRRASPRARASCPSASRPGRRGAARRRGGLRRAARSSRRARA